MSGEGEWPHHQILRVHRQYAFRQHLRLQEAIPYLMKNKAIPKNLCKEITKFPENNDDNINFLLAYLREAKVERFVRFVEALGESISRTSHAAGKSIKSHYILIETMSEALEKISNADMDQVRRVRAVVQSVKTDATLGKEMGVATDTTVVEGEVVHGIAGLTKESESDVVPITEAETTLKFRETECENTITQIENQSTSTSLEESCKLKYYPGYVEPRLVEFCSHGNITESQNAWSIYDPAHGVSIHIPVDAIASDVMTFAVIMHAYLNGNFEIPDEYELCTAVLILSTDPKLEFLKPVSLKLPHSLVFDGDEEDDDLVILRAKDPNISTHTETETPVYVFNDVIVGAEFSESYIQVDLDHFCGVFGARKKLRYRKSNKSTSSLRSLSRQSSVSKQIRSRKYINKMRRKKLGGDSIGSSPQSSYDDSFEKNVPLLSQQHSGPNSSIESDETTSRQLKRQAAMEYDDDLPDSPLLQQASSRENTCCNELYISCFNPVKCTSAWTTRFMVAPNIPTGKLALDGAMKEFEKQCRTKMESVFHVAFPFNHFIGFVPDSFIDDNWIVRATTTPQISLDLIYFSSTQPPHIDFTTESQNRSSSASLYQKIIVTGAEAQGNYKQIYFTIKSTDKNVFSTEDGVIITQSWLYSDNSFLLQILDNSTIGSDDNNIALNICYSHNIDTAELDSRSADIRKLITDIVLQLPPILYDDLIIQLELTEYDKSWLTFQEKDITERMYLAIFKWIRSKHSPNLEELKTVLANLGFHSIVLSSTDVNLVTRYPGVIDQMCNRDLCTKLAPSLGRHWRYVARYLGLKDILIDELLIVADREGTEEAVYQMLNKWQQQYYMTATVKTLVRAISRVGQHNSSYMTTASWCIEKYLCTNFS